MLNNIIFNIFLGEDNQTPHQIYLSTSVFPKTYKQT